MSHVTINVCNLGSKLIFAGELDIIPRQEDFIEIDKRKKLVRVESVIHRVKLGQIIINTREMD